MNFPAIAATLALLAASNAVPWALGRLFGDRASAPIDFGITLPDGRRLLGSHKTWRGFVGGCVATALVARLFSIGLWAGAAFGALSLAGDALSSFAKRRLDLRAGREILGLDQLPESILPLAVLAPALRIGVLDAVVTVAVFTIADVVTAGFRHRRQGRSESRRR